jgi:type-F conjugative transfer system mating-pair stabilization protein TraN
MMLFFNLKNFFLVVFVSLSVTANPWQHLNQGDQLAQQFLNQAGAHPFYSGIPSESKLSERQLKGTSAKVIQQNAASQMVYESSDTRPQFKIDPQADPLMTGAEMTIDNSLEVIGGKGTKLTRVQHSGKDEIFTCEEGGEDSLETCTRELHVRVIKKKVKKEWNANFFISKCSVGEKDGHHIPCASLRQSLFQARWASNGFGLKMHGLDFNTALNITAAYKACVREVATKKAFSCSQCTVALPGLPSPLDQIQTITLLKHPHNAKQLYMKAEHIHTYNSGRCEYYFQPYIKISYEKEEIQVLPDEWVSSCTRLEERVDQGLCTYDSKACSIGRQTRLIEGVPITKDCWEETYTYSCSYPSNDDCGPLRARGCAQISSTCKQQVGRICVVYNQAYQCKGSTTTTESITGGKTSALKVPFCLDGNCRDQGYEANDEMMSSLAQLTLLKEMQGQIENSFIFKGEDNRCSKCAVSFKDCCGSGKGWGKSIGLTDCSSQERALKKKRDVGLCHYVGTYCAEKIPIIGTCIKKKSTYCCFGSKLLKAFHDQGRPQLGLGWGSAEEPLCRGFTIEEIQQIDFSKLDLREVYEELMKKFNPGKMENMGRKIEERMEIIKKNLTPNTKQQPKQRPEA